MKKISILIGLLLVCCSSLRPQDEESKIVKFHSADIENFWSAYDQPLTHDPKNCHRVYDEMYLKNASQGLKDFYSVRIENSESLCKHINKFRNYYNAVRKLIPDLNDFSTQILSSYKKFKELYPEATEVEVYYLVGKTTTAGTIQDNRMLIGVEMFALGEAGIDKNIVPEHLRPYKINYQSLPVVIVHELIHTQQKLNGDLSTLLDLSLNEGAADFITKLTYGSVPNPNIYDYGYKNEARFKKLFAKKMYTKDVKDFLYNSQTNSNPDVGYFMGYRIVESYYEKQKDKSLAIKNILNIEDSKKFVKESGYF